MTKTKMHMSAAVCSNHLYPPHDNHHDCWAAVTVHTLLLRGRVFRLNSSCALLLQLPIASLAPAPGIVIRDGCGRNVHGACTYAFARLAGRGVASRGSSSSMRFSSTWFSSTTTPITTLVSAARGDKGLGHSVRCNISLTERGKLNRPAMRCTWVTCSLSVSSNDDCELSESALVFCVTKSTLVPVQKRERHMTTGANGGHTYDCE